MKRKKICKCRGVSQCGGSKKLSPAQMKKIMGPVVYRPMPVYGQRGGDFLGIASWAKRVVKNPLRLAGAIGTFGMSEAAIKSGQAFKKITGVKPSKALNVLAPVASFMGAPEIGLPAKAVSFGYKQIGLGKKKKRKHKPKKKRKRKK